MINTDTVTTELAVIGAGPGGYAAAFLASDLGIRVTLIDMDRTPGGVCLHRGCIPSKALLHVAKLLSDLRQATSYGIEFREPKIQIDKVRAWKGQIVQRIANGLSELCARRKVSYVQGKASFADSNRLLVRSSSGHGREIRFKHAILAAGTRPVQLKGFSFQSARVWDSTKALELETVPKTMLIVGGGYIGLELGTVYAALGTEISVAEMTPGLLPGADRDLVNILARRLERIFHSILLKVTVVGMEEKDDTTAVIMRADDGREFMQEFETVLVAVGRKPNTDRLCLENTKVRLNEAGFVIVDKQRRTSDRNIFAIGDVTGEPMLAHKAAHEGRVAVEVIAGRNATFEPKAIPAAVFTDPELAWCGLTEMAAKEQKRAVNVVRFPWGASGRASTLGRKDGLTKLIIDPETERLLGMGIAGTGAGELISEGALAIQIGATASDIKLTIHPHPTLSETIMESAELFFGQCTHMYRPRKT